MTEPRTTIAVLGCADGPTAEAGVGVLARLDPQRYERVALLVEPNEAGGARTDVVDRTVQVTPLDEPGFADDLADAIQDEALHVVLPGSPRAAAALARMGRQVREAGAAAVPVRIKALQDLRGARLATLARKAGIPCGRRAASTADDLATALAEVGSWPLLLLGEHGARRAAGDPWEAIRARESLAKKGGAIFLAEWRRPETYEVLLVLDPDHAVTCAAAVRVLADDERGRPWMAVTIDNPALVRAMGRLARDAKVTGPVTGLFQRVDGAFQLLDATPGFPLWIEATGAEGPDPVAHALALAKGVAPDSPDDPPVTPAGILFSQTAEDYVVARPAPPNHHD